MMTARGSARRLDANAYVRACRGSELDEPGVCSRPAPLSPRELRVTGSIRTVRGLCRAPGTVAICRLRGARRARLHDDRPWSRSCVPDYATRHAANDGSHGAANNRTRDCAANDSGDGSITVSQGKLRSRDEGHGCDEKERFLVHEFLQFWLTQHVIGNCAISARPTTTRR
jgi:hypothetical protein